MHRLTQHAVLLGVCLVGLLTWTPGCSSAPSRYEPPADVVRDVESLAGSWRGIALSENSAALLELQLSIPSGSEGADAQILEGRAFMQSFKDHLAGRPIASDTSAGSCSVRVVHDRLQDTFDVQVMGNAGRSHGRFLQGLGGASGIIDTRLGRLSGQLRSTHSGAGDLFVLARPDAADPLLGAVERLGETPSGRNRELSAMFATSFPTGATREDWLRPVRGGDGQLDLSHPQRVLQLFADEPFAKAFDGAYFDELSGSDLDNIYWTLREAGQSRDRDMKALGIHLQRAFLPAFFDNSAARTTLAVLAMRSLDGWLAQRPAAAQDIAAGPQAVASLDATLQRIQQHAQAWLPAQRVSEVIQRVAVQRSRLVEHPLRESLDSLAASAPEQRSIHALSRWSRDHADLLRSATAELRAELEQRAAVLADETQAALVPALAARLDGLGQGLEALRAGEQWWRDAQLRLGAAVSTAESRAMFDRFERLRDEHLREAAGELERITRAEFEGLPPDDDSVWQADEPRLAFIHRASDRAADPFRLDQDRLHPAVVQLREVITQLVARAQAPLPPRKRGPATAAPAAPDLAARGLRPYDPLLQYAARNPTFDTETSRWARLPAPITDAGFPFRTNVCWALFHGRFDELALEHYQDIGGLTSRMTRELQGENPLVHYAFISWVGLSSGLHGEHQIGPTTEMWWNTTQDGVEVATNQHRVTLELSLSKHYESSYRLAKAAADADGLFGNGLADMLESFLEVRDSMAAAAFGQGDALTGMLDRRADGSLTIKAADWERDLLADIESLLTTWPRQSMALWQFQENVNRHLEGRPSLQQLFATTRSELGWNRLHVAALADDVEALDRALATGLDVEATDRQGRGALALAATHGSSATARALIGAGAAVDRADPSGRRALHWAVLLGHEAMTQVLLDAGAEADARDRFGGTPLHLAVVPDERGCVTQLLAAGASPQAADQTGRLPLHAAAASNSEAAIQLLLDFGAAVDAADTIGAQALHEAAGAGAAEAIGLLVAAGADVDARTQMGHTPLHVAAIGKALAAIRPLVLRGADLHATDNEGRTPLQLAILGNDDVLIDALRSADD